MADPAPSPDRSRVARAWYEVVRLLVFLGGDLLGGLRVTGREHLPKTGGGLIVSNHLSHLDVLFLAVGMPRPLNFVARSSLFVPPLGFLIRTLGAFPIEREGTGLSGLKETLRRLKRGQLVLIFPEGTRSPTGELGPLKPGIAALARAGVPFYPVGLAGTFEALPRGRAWPRRHPIWIHFGPPILPDVCGALTPEALTDLIRDRLLECRAGARASLARLTGGAENP